MDESFKGSLALKKTDLAKVCRTTAVFILALTISACSNQPTSSQGKNTVQQASGVPQSLWVLEAKPIKAINPDTIYQLTEQQKKDFLSYFHREDLLTMDPHQRLAEYMNYSLDGFSVEGETNNAANTIDSMKGNCVSLAVMASALARVAGIQYIHRKVNRAPLYNRSGNIEFSSQHIRTVLFKPRTDLNESIKYIYIDYYRADSDIPAEAITQKEFNALYFANLAAEHIVKGELDLAYQYSTNVILQDPNNPESINLHAVVLKLMGHVEKSEALFSYAYKNLPVSINLYANYSQLLQGLNKLEAAKEVDSSIAQIQTSNPYDWITLGYDEYNDQNYYAAIRYFEKAQRYAPYLDDVYLALAKVHFKLDKTGAARNYLEQAMNAPVKSNSIKLFEAKLAHLDNVISGNP